MDDIQDYDDDDDKDLAELMYHRHMVNSVEEILQSESLYPIYQVSSSPFHHHVPV